MLTSNLVYEYIVSWVNTRINIRAKVQDHITIVKSYALIGNIRRKSMKDIAYVYVCYKL